MRNRIAAGTGLFALCLVSSGLADTSVDARNIAAATELAGKVLQERGVMGLVAETKSCFAADAARRAAAKLQFCLALDLAGFKLVTAQDRAGGWPVEDFYQNKAYVDRTTDALGHSSVPAADRQAMFAQVRQQVDAELNGAPRRTQRVQQPAPAAAIRPRPHVDPLVFDRQAMAASDPATIPLWDRFNTLIAQYNRGAKIDVTVLKQMSAEALRGQPDETRTVWSLGTRAADAAYTMTRALADEEQQQKVVDAEAAVHREAAAALERQRIDGLNLPKGLAEGTLMFRFRKPFAWLTVAQWLALVLENPEVKLVTTGTLEADGSPGISIKRPGQETFSFAFANDDGDVFVRAYGGGDRLSFVRQKVDEFGAMSSMMRFARDPTVVQDLVGPDGW